jgi:glycerophosphoryl diester phosphodiesterase
MSSHPLLIAHRGESFDAPENTHAAFDLAWERGCDGIELDVHLSADGHVVVCHDADTLRTGGVKHVIAETSLAVLHRLDLGAWKAPAFAGQRLATLDDVLMRVPAGRVVLVEIKSGVGTVDPVATILEEHEGLDVTVIAFNLDVVRGMKQRQPERPVLWLISPKRDEATGTWSPTPAEMIAGAKSAGADGIDVDQRFPVEQIVDEVRRAGLSLHVWTVDDPSRARALVAAGVDGVTSNRAAWLRGQL